MNSDRLQHIGAVGPIQIAVEPDGNVEPGHQWVLISAAGGAGLALVYVLSGMDLQQLGTENEVALGDETYFRIPHTAEVDRRLRELVDLCAAIRFAAPGLVQLTI